MGRFHRHGDGTVHPHLDPHPHPHDLPDPHALPDPHPAPDPHHHPHPDHGGYATATERLEILERIFDDNDRVAAANRRSFDDSGVRVVNLMSSPGAGKTSLLHAGLRRICETMRVAVIEGDIETSIDADRLAGLGAAVECLNTSNGFGAECHLDATMVQSVLPRLDLAHLDLILVENVGNLVCPAEFHFGEHSRAMVYSVTEGEEKPLKYPVMFRAVELVAVNKVDLLPHLDFELDLFLDNLRTVNPQAETILTSAKTGQGVNDLCDWLAGSAS